MSHIGKYEYLNLDTLIVQTVWGEDKDHAVELFKTEHGLEVDRERIRLADLIPYD